MLIARVAEGPRTERARSAGSPAAGRGWVDPLSTSTADARPTPAPVAGGAIAALAGVDALLVLQRVEEPADRRQRAARRGARLLDGLERLRRGLLDGTLPEATLRELRVGLAELEAVPDQPRLQSVLTEIAVRVEVELAKLERAAATAERSPRGPPAGPGEVSAG